MIKFTLCRLLALSILGFISCSVFCNNKVAHMHDGLDLVVVLSTGCEEVLKVDNIKHEPCCNELFAACKDEQIALVSPSILYGLLKRKRKGQDPISECIDKITHGYAAYLNRDEDFVLLIPATKSKNLKEIGFDETQFSCIEPEKLMQFSEDRWASHLIEIDHFKKLFRQEESGYQPPAKYIYLISHGIDALDELQHFKWSMPLIASLAVWQFVNFLQMLNTINTKFLHIASCYAAGVNFCNVNRILAGEVEDERCINACCPLKFSIMMQGTTDSPVSAIIGDGQGCKSFFSLIRQWLDNNNDGDMLAQLLSQSLYTCKQRACFCNYPVLRLSDCVSLASLPVDGVAVITQDKGVVSVDNNMHHLFFYPVCLYNTTITLESIAGAPQCISKIPGKACHFLGAIQVSGLDKHTCISLLENCFLKEVIRDPSGTCCYGVSDKAWFIHRLVTEGQHAIAKGVVVHKGMLKYGVHNAVIAYQDSQGIFHRVNISLPVTQQKTWRDEVITELEYSKLVSRIFWETRADEQRESAEQCIGAFFNDFGMSVPVIDVRSMVQEDLQQIRVGSLKKEAYLNYVAHVHDAEILHELIEACINMSDVIGFVDIAKILTHLIEVEQQDMSLSTSIELLGKDDSMPNLAAIATLTDMALAGLYVHASRAIQEVLTVVDKIVKKVALDGKEVLLFQEISNFFVQLIHVMIKEGKIQAAEFIINIFMSNEHWYIYGLGLKVSAQMLKEYPADLPPSSEHRLQWFTEQLQKHHTSSALAVYFEKSRIVDEYRNLLQN